MLRRLGAWVLIVAISLVGLTACPRGALSCTLAMQANHHCCGNGAALRKVNCCSRNGSGPAPIVGSGMISQHDDLPRQLLAIAPLVIAPSAAGVAFISRVRRDCGPAPPQTPLTRHTTLLL